MEQADEEKWILAKIYFVELERRRAKKYTNQLIKSCTDEERPFIESFFESIRKRNIRKGEGYQNSTDKMKELIEKYCDF